MGTWDTYTTVAPNSWQVMQEYLPNKLLRRYRDMFNRFDHSCTGVISVTDVALILSQNGHDHEVDVVKKILKNINYCTHDENYNHKYVDFSEFLVVISASAKNCIPEDEMLKIFNIFDQDGDGFIGREELRSLLSKLGDEVSEKEVEEMIEEADKDGDGLVSYQEFVRIITNSMDNPIECEKNCAIEEKENVYFEGLKESDRDGQLNSCLSDDAVFSDGIDDGLTSYDTDDNCFDSNCNFSPNKPQKKRFMRRSLRGSISWLSRITSRRRVYSSDKFNNKMYNNYSHGGKSMTLPNRSHKSCENILDSFSQNKSLKTKKNNFSVDNLRVLTLRKKKRNFSSADIL